MKRKVKALGQHFLKNRSVLKKIIQCISPGQDDLVIEVGAGRGALTFPLARRAGKVVAVERDKSLIPVLQGKKIPNLEIIEADILRVDIAKLIKDERHPFERVKVVGNLPYAISSPLLFKLLREKEAFHKCVFLLQREVAERVCALPGTKKYAPLSIIFQVYFETKLHFITGPESFSPPPQVESALVSLTKRQKPLHEIEREAEFLEFLKGAFRHRRKMLVNNLMRLGYERPLVKDAFTRCGVEGSVRAEQVPIGLFICLFTYLINVKRINLD